DDLSTLVSSCTDPADKLAEGLVELAGWRDRIRDAPDEYEQVRLLTEGAPRVRANSGQKGNWWGGVNEERGRVRAMRDRADAIMRTITEATVRRLAWEIAQFTLREAGERRRSGRLEFHDLLVLSRAMLRDARHGADVRRRFRARYTHLLL